MLKRTFASDSSFFSPESLRNKVNSIYRNLEGFAKETEKTAGGIYDEYGKPLVEGTGDIYDEYGKPILEGAEDIYDEYGKEHVDDFVDYTGEALETIVEKGVEYLPEEAAFLLGGFKGQIEEGAKKISSGDVKISNKAKEKGQKASSDLLDLIAEILSGEKESHYKQDRAKRMEDIKDFNKIVKVDKFDSDYDFKGRYCKSYLEEFVSAIGMKESGSVVSTTGEKFRKYKIKNPDSYATGFTQIMPYSFKGFYEKTTGENFKDYLTKMLMEKSPSSVWMAEKYYDLYDELSIVNKKIKKLKKQKLNTFDLYQRKKEILKEMSIIIDKSGISDGEVQEDLSSGMMSKYFDRFGDWAKVAIAWYAGPGSQALINFDENKLSDDYIESRIGYLDSKNKYSGVYTYSRKVMKNFKAILGSKANSCI